MESAKPLGVTDMRAGWQPLAVCASRNPTGQPQGRGGGCRDRCWRPEGTAAHCQNSSQTPPPPPVFILKNKSLNLKEEDQLNLLFGEPGEGNGSHHWKLRRSIFPIFWVNKSLSLQREEWPSHWLMGLMEILWSWRRERTLVRSTPPRPRCRMTI